MPLPDRVRRNTLKHRLNGRVDSPLRAQIEEQAFQGIPPPTMADNHQHAVPELSMKARHGKVVEFPPQRVMRALKAEGAALQKFHAFLRHTATNIKFEEMTLRSMLSVAEKREREAGRASTQHDRPRKQQATGEGTSRAHNAAAPHLSATPPDVHRASARPQTSRGPAGAVPGFFGNVAQEDADFLGALEMASMLGAGPDAGATGLAGCSQGRASVSTGELVRERSKERGPGGTGLCDDEGQAGVGCGGHSPSGPTRGDWEGGLGEIEARSGDDRGFGVDQHDRDDALHLDILQQAQSIVGFDLSLLGDIGIEADGDDDDDLEEDEVEEEHEDAEGDDETAAQVASVEGHQGEEEEEDSFEEG